ncbi:hypothetical protein [Mycobacterium sp. Marseille-P9652]|uniref:hypothetical protein n=1 Tax=Mycobacterium sp. Marseille-P9652 TaxID=2654950 RepID=UPI001E2D3804|nr:hypothetical protein [Mycobacterium sp. Marseille-P9652]
MLVVATVILRGHAITDWRFLNPDETGLLVWGRAALHSPVPFSTWQFATLGPFWPLFLAGLAALGAPLTFAFAHMLTAILLALTAAVFFVAGSRAIGRGPALVATMVWWLPLATTFGLGFPEAYNTLSTEYLPVLLVVASALVPREQLAARPWLFAVLGLLAGLAIGAKPQVAPLAGAFAVAQVIVLRPNVRRIVVAVLWWLVGAILPLAAIALVVVVSPATNWTLVEQNFSAVLSYGAGPSLVQRFAVTFGSLIAPGGYILVALAGLIWLARHSDRSSNVARVVLITGGLAAMLFGGRGFPPYNILLFGAGALAATMPVNPDASLLPPRMTPKLVAGALAMVAALVLVAGYLTNTWRPTPPRMALAAFSPNSVHRNPIMARECPPGSRAMVWGWAGELYIEQDWQSTTPYTIVGGLVYSDALKKSAEPVVRASIDQAKCVVDTSSVKRAKCPGESLDAPVPECLPERITLSRFYPELFALVARQFHAISVDVPGCEGCVLYVRNVPS